MEHIRIGSLYYNLTQSTNSAEVTYEVYNDENYLDLTEVNIPSSVTYAGKTYKVNKIGNYAFCSCSEIASFSIPNSVSLVGLASFAHCKSLTSIQIPNTVKSIGDHAFWDCTRLINITLKGETPPTLGNYSFSNCSNLLEIYVPCGTSNAYKESWSDYSSLITYAPVEYTINAETNIAEAGNVVVLCSVCETSVTANHNYGYHFVQWNDGNTDNPRTIVLTQDTIFTAEFAKNTYMLTTTSANEARGITFGDTTALYLDEMEISATPNYGYHFVQWNDGNTDNPRTIVLTQDTTFTAEFAKSIYTITKNTNTMQGYISGVSQAEYLDNVKLEAIPYNGYQFIRWADGKTDNPRTIELTQDTTMEAFFDYLLEGKCGKDSALTWKLDTTTMSLNISGKGALSENYTYGKFIEELTIGNEISQIGKSAFDGCSNLKDVIIGSSVKVLEEYAFSYCYAIEIITCYSQRPPTVNNNALYGLEYETIVYVPADYLNNYMMHDAWGLYDVRPLGATNVETTDVEVTPSETTAEVVWPAISGAATYELVIKDKKGNVICTLVFNAQGQLTQIAFHAPARNYAPQQTQSTGFSFTVTGLAQGTSYDLTMTSKDSNGEVLESTTLSFSTSGPATAIDNFVVNENITKILRDGQILILRGDKTYTVTGQEVK